MLKAETERLRVACMVPDPEDGTSWYRAMGPLNAMVREDSRLELVLPRKSFEGTGWSLSWDWLSSCDVLFCQRAFLEVHVQCVKMAIALGMPVWCEWDDLLWCVPHSNPKYELFSDEAGIRKRVEEMIRLSNVVTTTTAELASRLGPKARVIPNAMHGTFHVERRRQYVAWRGAAGHEEDVCSVLPQLETLARLPQLSKWTWMFCGRTPWQVEKAIPATRLEMVPGALLPFWVPLLGVLAPYILVVPLLDSRFNRCKSNIAWIEGTQAGAVVLAPDWPEWHRPGVVNYKDAKDFKEQLHLLMEGYDGGMHPRVRESRDYISANLTLPQVNQARWEILNELRVESWKKKRENETDEST